VKGKEGGQEKEENGAGKAQRKGGRKMGRRELEWLGIPAR